MKTPRWIGNVLAVALVGVAGLSLSQFAATQESQPKKDAATQKSDKAEAKEQPKETESKQGVSKFMRMKLEASQKILAGLALEDYELIQEGANKLDEMSAAEKWRVTRDPLYREHSVDFQKITRRLAKNAKEGKLDASALTWFEATMQCIECHKWARANLVAKQ